MKDYWIKLTLGQSFFAFLCVTLVGLLSFYLGARYGVEYLWGSKTPQSASSVLPDDLTDQELEALISSEKALPLTFNKTLENKNDEVQEFIIKEEPEKVEAVPEVKPVAEQKKKEVKEDPKKKTDKKTNSKTVKKEPSKKQPAKKIVPAKKEGLNDIIQTDLGEDPQ